MLNPVFDTSITQYNVEIANDITKLNILAIPENENGKVEVSGNENLKEGENQIIITVTAPNGFTNRQYVINVYKRNVLEEEQYKEEESKKEDKLEQAYQIEKVSANDQENLPQQSEGEQQKNYWWIAIIVVLIVLLASGINYYYKRKNKINV